MLKQSVWLKPSTSGTTDDTTSLLRQEYQAYQSLFQAQPTLVQQYLRIQAAALAEAVLQKLHHVQFKLPDRVAVHSQNNVSPEPIPDEYRVQQVGGLVDSLVRTDLPTMLRLRLLELEHTPNQAVSTAGMLTRHALVIYMVHDSLPAGKTVQYMAPDGDEIPSIPVDVERKTIPALEDSKNTDEPSGDRRIESAIPYVEAARRFYMPQWVAFDEQEHLLLNNLSEAEATIASMQHYLRVLHAAVGMAPYIVANEEYQRKRYGILGQLVNQGRALANFEVQEIIRTIERRAASHSLDRGLRLSVPYFNDQTLTLETFEFEVIPAGRVMFVPAFVVLAARAQGAKVAQDTRLSQSTRRHILAELGTFEKVFLR